MGRSRGNFHINDEDSTARSRRKKNVSNENAGISSSGLRTNEGKRALYHCNYCNKDITGRIRIKCAICPDFDLCIECFTVGAEVSPHKSNHPYRVMDNLSFPLISPDWNADEEILLLEGVDMYGLCNWTDVSEHVGTKDIKLCVDHYTNMYLNSPFFPLPDMSHVAGKNKKEILDGKGHAEDKKGASMIAKLSLKEKSHFSPRIEEPRKSGSSGRSESSVNTDANPERKSNGKKSISSGIERPLAEMHGYNSKRQEFDVEYDNDAEQMLAEMEFKDTDTKEEKELKLRVLRIYSKRIDERQRRKDFIKERNLLQPNPFERDLSAEERVLCRQYDVFMRFHSKEDHEELLRTVISEHRMKKRIQDLKDARAAGCRSTAEADRWLELKRRVEGEASPRTRESSQGGQDGSNVFVFKAGRPAGQASSSHVNDFDIMRFRQLTLLSEAEKCLCADLRLPPPLYMKMQGIISRGVFSGNVKKKADAHRFFKNIDPSIVDRVFDMLVKKGLASPP